MIYLLTLLTILAFTLAVKINTKLKSVILNSFVLSVLILIALLLSFDIPYDTYMQGNAPLNNLLGVGVVALALPFYEQLPQIRRQWRGILLVTTVACVFSMLTGAGLALLLGASPEIVASVLPKSVTTPIAMEIAKNVGGQPAIAVVGVIVAGLQGSIFGYVVMKKLGMQYEESVGLSIGAVSHALGTASLMSQAQKAGSYSSLSLVLCGILSSLLAPFVFKLIYLAI
ncbi:putative murein hydrolase (TIGR00659 family) [Cricetibacter osteomyelitidis]|uniref:Putative murein hydrolase (TIGR00659 family) n=2 Tax=Cricetibacter osteomyelitidis TaxID=1521931 RepID=A0A4R2SPG8_9PAST|nr:putative murein hydrolase (TIGR00659 family) [Cricetibacter osteomyelitidis]